MTQLVRGVVVDADVGMLTRRRAQNPVIGIEGLVTMSLL